MEEQEEEKKITRILVLADQTEYGNSAIEHAIFLKHIFQSELEILKPESNQSNKKLYQYAEVTNTILIVLSIPDEKSKVKTFWTKKRGIRFIRHSRIPVLVVGNQLPNLNAYLNVMLPIDVDRQAKEKAMWASYFVRFYSKLGLKGKIHVVHNLHKEPELSSKVSNNIEFIEKLYKNLELDYEIHKYFDVFNIDQKSIEVAPNYDATVTVIMMTKFYSLIDILFGPKETQIIGNSEGFPILCLNEREDLYVLCQ
jgi:hypothetical protein